MCLIEPLQWCVFNASIWDCPSENISFQSQSPFPWCLKSVETVRSSALASLHVTQLTPFWAQKSCLAKSQTEEQSSYTFLSRVVHLLHLLYVLFLLLLDLSKIAQTLNWKSAFWLLTIIFCVYSDRLRILCAIHYFIFMRLWYMIIKLPKF